MSAADGRCGNMSPRDPHTGDVLPPRAQPGYYAGFSVLGQARFWDEATRAVVTARVHEIPAISYFDQATAQFWAVVFEHLIPQTDRVEERRIPIVNVVDRRLSRNETAGYRFADMPPDREAYRLGREAIEAESNLAYDQNFLDLTFSEADVVVKTLHDGRPRAAQAIWKRMSVHRFWGLIMGDAAEAYYAHPWAWDEIGFGGPAYPRAYTRLERGDPEPWEVREQRYAWAAPPESQSAEVKYMDDCCFESEQHRLHVNDATHE